MSDELKACPFCGGPATRNDDEGDPDELYMSCMNVQCCGGEWWFKPDQWQNRAIESALEAKLKIAEKQLEEQRIHLRGLLKVADQESAQVALARVKNGLQGYLEVMEKGWEVAPEPLPIPELRLKLSIAVEALESISNYPRGHHAPYTESREALAKIRS